MPDILANLGNTAIGAGMGLLLEGHNDRRQLQQQQALNSQQFNIDNQMAEQNYQRQMRLWHDTNATAQVAELKKAGLNPALMYKQGGPGGTTAAATGQVNAAKAPAGGMEIMNMMMQQAQIRNLEAQTKNIEADTLNKPKTGAQIEATTENLQADTANKQVTKEILETQSYMANIQAHIAGETQNDAVAMVRTGLRKFTAEMHTAETQQKINSATADNNIKIVAADYINILLQNEQIRQTTGKTKQEIENLKQQVKNMVNDIDISKGQLAIDQQIANFNTSFGNQVGGIIGNLLNLIPALGTKKTQNTTIHKKQ